MPITTRAAIGAACLIAGLITGCGSDDSTTTKGDATASGSDAAATAPNLSGKDFVYIGGQTGDPNYAQVGCGARAVAKKLGATVIQQDVKKFTAASQTPTLNAVAARKPDGIIISPTDPVGLFAPIKATTTKGVPVVTAVNSLDDPSALASQVLVDNYGGGVKAAQYLAQKAAGKKVKISVFSFTKGGSKAADDEWKGFEAEIKKHPNVEYLGPQFVADDAAKKMAGVLSRNPDLYAVFSTFAFAGQGILTTVKQRNADVVQVTAYGASFKPTADALKAGTIDAIVDYPFVKAGEAAMQQLANKLQDKPTKPTVRFGSEIFTKGSLSDPEKAAKIGVFKCDA